MEQFLLQLFIVLVSAAIAVPIAKACGLGSVLGYLIAGIVIGPFGISLMHDVEDVMHFTEFGIVMMLFLVGLELKPSLLWHMKVPILGVGGAQVLLSSIILGGVALCFVSWQQALAIGLILSLSSTAIVLQTLNEKGLMGSASGKSVFSVLLFQDLAVIPMLALLPLLATFALGYDSHHEAALFNIRSLPGYVQIMVTVLAITAILVLGKFASRPVFRAIAHTRIRELFVAVALALVVGISLLMMVVGMSPALGAFLGGVVLADSEYRHELESDIEPFKGLLLGIFFISIGASLNFTLIGNEILLISALTVGLIGLKWLVLYLVGRAFKMPSGSASFFAVALAQGGEFAFVLFQFAKVNGVLTSSTVDPLISAVALSMFLAPVLFVVYDKASSKSNIKRENNDNADEISHSGQRVILAGFGRMGVDIGRMLISAGIKPVILDNNPDNVNTLRKLGYEVYYGDVTRLDLLESAGAGHAELLIVSVSEVATSRQLVELAHKHFSHLRIIASAYDRKAAFELMDMNVDLVRRETSGSAIDLGQQALNILGFEPYEAHRLARIFDKKDREVMPELHQASDNDVETYISTYRKHSESIEVLMSFEKKCNLAELEKTWVANNPEK